MADEPESKKPKTPYFLEAQLVGDMVAECKCVVKYQGLVIFVEGAVPGDLADLRIYKQKKSFAEAAIHRLITPSPERVNPHCEHFGICGGCNGSI